MSIFLRLTIGFTLTSILTLVLVVHSIQTNGSTFIIGLGLGILVLNLICWATSILLVVRPVLNLHKYIQALGSEDELKFAPSANAKVNYFQKQIASSLELSRKLTAASEAAKCEAEGLVKKANDALELSHAKELENKELLVAMASLAGKAKDVSRNIYSALMQLSQHIAEIDNGVQAQRFQIESTSETLAGMLRSIDEVATRAQQAAEGAQTSQTSASLGVADVHKTVEVIETVKQSTLALKQTMQLLVHEADSIGSVMGVISEVADQTNLLALNAAIEAARAGEAGRGFAVVADEVRKLAERTMNATQEVAKAVKNIQDQTQQNMDAVDAAAAHTVHGAELATKIGSFMTEIISNIGNTSEHMQEIAKATQMQSQSSRSVGEALDQLTTVSKKTTENMEVITGAAVRVSSHMEGLELIIHGLASGNTTPSNSAKLVEWTPKLATNVKIIDDQHKVLCNLINELHAAMLNEDSVEVMHNIVDGLAKYATVHFDTEENIFSRSKYPHTEAHKKIHRDFVAKVNQVKQEIVSGRAMVSIDLLNFLKDWLIKHIDGTDLGYCKYVHAK